MLFPGAPGSSAVDWASFAVLAAVSTWSAGRDAGYIALAGVVSMLITGATATGMLDHATRIAKRMGRSERCWSVVGLIAAVWLCVCVIGTTGRSDYGDYGGYADCYSYMADSYSAC